MSEKIKVVFVCMGNICRSPTAHASFRALVKSHNLEDKIMVDSAGTHAYHVGNPPDLRAQEVANSRGIAMADLRARQISWLDLEKFDFILVMDEDNLDLVKELASEENEPKIKLFLQYASKDWGSLEVPDPYYGGVRGFTKVFDMIEDASVGLLAQIKRDMVWN